MRGFITQCVKGCALFALLVASACESEDLDLTLESSPAPALSLPRLSGGDRVDLQSYRGRVVYLDFWGSWCAPCAESLPFLNEVRSDHARGDFEVLAINLDEDRDAAVAFLKEYPVDYPVLADPTRSTLDRFGVTVVPSSFLIDRNGDVRHRHRGFKAADMTAIRRRIEIVIAEQAPIVSFGS